MNAKRKLLEKLMRNGDIDGADKLASEICRACGADMSRGVSLSDVRKNLNATKRRMRWRTFAAVVLFMLVAAALTVGAAFFYGGDGVGDGGSEARAMAPNVSIIRFTHSICVTVSGDSVPKNEPNITNRHAATFTVSWNSRKRCMF